MASSEASTPPVVHEKAIGARNHGHTVTTNEQVPGHPAYYEEGGLRTYGDDMDHDHEPPVLKHFPPLLSFLYIKPETDTNTDDI